MVRLPSHDVRLRRLPLRGCWLLCFFHFWVLTMQHGEKMYCRRLVILAHHQRRHSTCESEALSRLHSGIFERKSTSGVCLLNSVNFASPLRLVRNFHRVGHVLLAPGQ